MNEQLTMNPLMNRLLAGLVTALIAPHIEQFTGIKLTDGDVNMIVGLAPLTWHAIAAVWARICAAFVLYFPPPQPGASPKV